MFVVELNYLKPLAEVDAQLEAHRSFLAEQYAAGVFLASGPKEPRSGGIILARAASAEALDAVLAADPFYLQGIAEYRVTRFHVRASAAGLEQLVEA